MTRHPVPTVFSCVASRNKRGRSAPERWQPQLKQPAASPPTTRGRSQCRPNEHREVAALRRGMAPARATLKGRRSSALPMT